MTGLITGFTVLSERETSEGCVQRIIQLTLAQPLTACTRAELVYLFDSVLETWFTRSTIRTITFDGHIGILITLLDQT